LEKWNDDELVPLCDKILQGDYTDALVKMRTLLEVTSRKLLKKRKKGIPKDPRKDTLGPLSSRLVEKKIIDGRLKSWFDAFLSYANPSTHGTLEVRQQNKQLLLRTIIIGHQLYSVMENKLNRPPKLELAKF
jgi:hypothetical protein